MFIEDNRDPRAKETIPMIQIHFNFPTTYWDFTLDCETDNHKKSWFGGTSYGFWLEYKPMKLSDFKAIIIREFCKQKFPEPVYLMSKLFIQYCMLLHGNKLSNINI